MRTAALTRRCVTLTDDFRRERFARNDFRCETNGRQSKYTAGLKGSAHFRNEPVIRMMTRPRPRKAYPAPIIIPSIHPPIRKENQNEPLQHSRPHYP
nr:MAG TPA: hypothetical protein [Caudoviricetes sp.]